MKEKRKETQQSGAREFLTAAQLAELLQLNDMTVYRMVKQGEIPYYMIGRMMRFRHDDVEEYLRSHRVAVRKQKA